jgi:hypothetical protein
MMNRVCGASVRCLVRDTEVFGSSAAWSTINPNDPDSNTDHSGGRPVANLLSYDTAK